MRLLRLTQALALATAASLAIMPAFASSQPQHPPQPSQNHKRQQPRQPLAGKIILLDPGHGGDDTGAYRSFAVCGLKPPIAGYKAPDVEERYITLSIARKTRVLLKQLGASIYMTREGDTTVDLPQITDMQEDVSLTPTGQAIHASSHRADASVSIHVNSLGVVTSPFDDIEVYSYFERGTALAAQVGKRMARELHKETRLIEPKRFYAIDHNEDVPAILIETGYITHPPTCRALMDPVYQWRIAKSIADGLLSYFGHPVLADRGIVKIPSGEKHATKAHASRIQNKVHH